MLIARDVGLKKVGFDLQVWPSSVNLGPDTFTQYTVVRKPSTEIQNGVNNCDETGHENFHNVNSPCLWQKWLSTCKRQVSGGRGER